MTLQTACNTLAASGRFLMRRCPTCGDLPVAPLQSEFVSGGCIHHLWSCDGCGREFHTRIECDPLDAAA